MQMKLSMFLFATSIYACSAAAPPQSELNGSSQAVGPKSAASPPTAAPASAPASHAANQAAELVRVTDPSTVCMVNDQYMGSPQIPVVVADKTYFGCCKMCEDKLKNNPDARSASDPSSQRSVDKATAVIARDASGKVFYFENERTLAKYAGNG